MRLPNTVILLNVSYKGTVKFQRGRGCGKMFSALTCFHLSNWSFQVALGLLISFTPLTVPFRRVFVSLI